jgi:beta-aspartyl-peptidase (threonine type)
MQFNAHHVIYKFVGEIPLMIVASANGDVGIGAGVEVLKGGGSAIDAVEAACRLVEDNLDDHSVGTGGYPNLRGEVELDASIMEGTQRRAGAVAAMKNYSHPISVARAVMEKLPQHLLLVEAGAERFAAGQGFETRDLLTTDAAEAFRRQRIVLAGEEYSFDTPAKFTASDEVSMMSDPSKTQGTVNFLARDATGKIASAVSTSGWAFKYPGRVGDSPLIGAGNYCDDRFGACACTGLGEWAIRAATAHSVVLAMQFGMTLTEACLLAMRDLISIPLPSPLEPAMSFVALDQNGTHAGYSTLPGRTYIWQTTEMQQFETRERVYFDCSKESVAG